MNVNGTRFHLLLGQNDWGRCSVRVENEMIALAEYWPVVDSAGQTIAAPARAPIDATSSWDDGRKIITLHHIDKRLMRTPGEQRYDFTHQRSPVADSWGNIYAISDDRRGITILSRGSGNISEFWQVEGAPQSISTGQFGDAIDRPRARLDGLDITALTISNENYLIAAIKGRLFRFDLIGGGAPEEFALPIALADCAATCLAPGECGGIWLLDSGARDLPLLPDQPKLFRLDRDLGFESSEDPNASVNPFLPHGVDVPPVRTQRVVTPILLPSDPLPRAIAPLANGQVIILSQTADAEVMTISCFAPGDARIRPLAELPYKVCAMATGNDDRGQYVVLADETGNQAHVLRIVGDGEGLSAPADPETTPMRRYGGRGLITFESHAYYDSDTNPPKWVPLVPQKRQYFSERNSFVTQVFDSKEPQCVWDRLRLDACIPAKTAVQFEARASDDATALGGVGEHGWVRQPSPYLNQDGGELGHALHSDRARNRSGAKQGCFDLLLQDVIGRFVELRITLIGDGQFTPHLRALRLWYPRFSYASHFLPAIYREEAGPASFIERFLASIEGVNTVVEGKIASTQSWFDTRTTPREALDWLAGWYEMALDPRWDERRRRLFIRFAPHFFNWRGTIKGMRLALRLGFDPCIDEDAFALEQPEQLNANSVRIIENFASRVRARRFGSAQSRIQQPRAIKLADDWVPEEGAAGLIARLHVAENPETGRDTSAQMPLFWEADDAPERALFRKQLGFYPDAGRQERIRWMAFQQGATSLEMPQTEVPPNVRAQWDAYLRLPARDRDLWQRTLREQYRVIGRLNAAWTSNWLSFGEIPIPDHLPETPPAIRDWLNFEGQILPMDRAAHRFAVLLPRQRIDFSREEEIDAMRRARRIIALEKPAHTMFDVRFHWAMNRIGEARIGSDTHLGQGSRAPELVPPVILGAAYISTGFILATEQNLHGREQLAC